MSLEAVNNKKQFHFEVALPDGDVATLEYRWLKGSMVLMHTFVPKNATHQGIASLLAKAALEYAMVQNIKVIVYCPFVAAFLKEHPEYDDLIEKK